MTKSDKTLDRKDILKQALYRIEDLQTRLDIAETAQKEPIAIVGIGCRFPGGLNGPQLYWDGLQQGCDAISEIPEDRWNADAIYDPDKDAPGKMSTKWGGFLEQIDQFDPYFFGISSREAKSMDPQQRLFLEVVWEALENAGIAIGGLKGSKTGVYVGVTIAEYLMLHFKKMQMEEIEAYTTTMNVSNAIAGRVSYTLGLHGPAMAIDTACSSSLVAIHVACQGLRQKECNMAIAGGVNTIVVPETFVSFSKWGMMAADGRCKTFDADADGFVRGEGCGAIVLKRQSDALADGDTILGLIRGSAVNQDGPSSGLSVPNGLAQAAVLRQAMESAGVVPGQIDYIEAHGTGTSLGDPIEVEAIASVHRDRTPGQTPLRIGSVKTNLGHLESAAGVAGVIKTVLALHHEQIPPQIHFKTPNPKIQWDHMPIEVVDRAVPWHRGERPRFAGVSAFGFSGTNAHIVLQEAPRQIPDEPKFARPMHLLTLSAKSKEALEALAKRFDNHLAGNAADAIGDIAYTANAGRTHFPHRTALVASDTDGIRRQLDAVVKTTERMDRVSGEAADSRRRKIAFLFTGQGAQYWGMGRQLYDTQPVFRHAFDECDRILNPLIGQSILSIVYENNDDAERLNETALTQPILFSLAYALSRLWQSWGVAPSAVMGHSVGEYVAATVAGVFTLETGLKLIATRARLMSEMPQDGAMAVIFANEDGVRSVLGPDSKGVSIAAVNGPQNVVVSGPQAVVKEVIAEFNRQKVRSQYLNVSHAFHSEQMEPILSAFKKFAGSLDFRNPKIPMISNVSGDFFSKTERPDGPYLARHIRQPVRFAAGMQALYDKGYRTFLECGPGATLLGMGKQCLPHGDCQWLPTLNRTRDDWQQVLETLGRLYVAGADIDWEAYDRDYSRRRVWLPTYPFQRKSFWIEERKSPTPPSIVKAIHADDGTFPVHPLLGMHISSPPLNVEIFDSKISLAEFPYLEDHIVQGVVILPLAAYLEMVSAAAVHLQNSLPLTLQDIDIREPLILNRDEEKAVQIIFTREPKTGAASFKFISRNGGGDINEDNWTLHFSGVIADGVSGNTTEMKTGSDFSTATNKCRQDIDIQNYYEELNNRGLQFGPRFKSLIQLAKGDREAFGKIGLSRDIPDEGSGYLIHPVLLDGCLQIFFAAFSRDSQKLSQSDTFLPLNVKRFRFYKPSPSAVWSHAVLQNARAGESGLVCGDITIFDGEGEPIAEFAELLIKQTPKDYMSLKQEGSISDWLYEIEWRSKAMSGQPMDDSSAADLPPVHEIVSGVNPHIPALCNGGAILELEKLLPGLDELSVAYIAQTLSRIGWAFQPGGTLTEEDLVQNLRIEDKQRSLFIRMLNILVEDGYLRKDASGWGALKELPEDDPDTIRRELVRTFPAFASELKLMKRCGPNLADVLKGDADPLQLLFPGGSFELLENIYQNSPLSHTMNQMAQRAIASTLAGISKKSPIKILEIGAGTGGTTSYLLPEVVDYNVEYVFTDISPIFLTQAREKFSGYPFVEYALLDIEKDPAEQDFAYRRFDIVIAANVLHATADLRKTMSHVQRLLKSDGMLALLEGTDKVRWIDLTFGLTEGWWKFCDTDVRPDYPLLTRNAWRQLLEGLAFDQVEFLPERDRDRPYQLGSQALIMARAPRSEKSDGPSSAHDDGSWLIFSDEGRVGTGLAAKLSENGQHSILVTPDAAYQERDRQHIHIRPDHPEDYDKLLENSAAKGRSPAKGIIYLWSLDAAMPAGTDPSGLRAVQMKSCEGILYLVQSMIHSQGWGEARLWLVSKGAQSVDGFARSMAVGQSLLWGLGKVVALEHPELHCTRIDLDPADADVSTRMLFNAVWSGEKEDQMAFRNGDRCVPRIVTSKLADPTGRHRAIDDLPGFRLVNRTPGALEGLHFEDLPRTDPGESEIEIRVKAAGLNFRDVLSALGMYPGDAGPLGGECAGRVVAVGTGVTEFKPGDRVMVVAQGSFASHVVCPAELAFKIPRGLDYEEAVTIPGVFMTALYTLKRLGRLQGGQTVLIHCASGGVGLAAVQIAMREGAEIYATAGNPEKRAFLRELGVRHVMDSRSTDFAKETLEHTNGRGVDLVLNSLSGDFIPKSLSATKEGGRFVEIGKRDIWDAGQVAAYRQLSAYHIVDLAKAVKEDPDLIRSILTEVIDGVERGELDPLPVRLFSHDRVIEAFRHMQQAKHIGKIVVGFNEDDAELRSNRDGTAARTLDQSPPQDNTVPGRVRFRSDGTYLIVGGLQGLGLLTAQWMVERQARHLVLMARSDATESAMEAIAGMRQSGATVTIAKGDVANEADLVRIIDSIRRSMPPLRGVFHSAGVLADGGLVQQRWSRFEKVLAPKMIGAWLLHELTQSDPLDFFVLYSSVSSLIGNRGQGNHASANAFLDVLAHHRRGNGLPGISIHWGAWSEIGAAAERKIGARISSQGIGTIAPRKGIAALEKILVANAAEVGVLPIDWRTYLASSPFPRGLNFLEEMAVAEPSPDSSDDAPSRDNGFLATYRQAHPNERKKRLIDFVREQAAKVLGLESLQTADDNKPLQELGLDSLLAVELRNLLGTGLELKKSLPATLLFDYPTIRNVADYLFREVLAPEMEDSAPVESGEPHLSDELAELENMTDEEAEALLLEELSITHEKGKTG
jgi:acyl transferase domain-containing protein/NADPH:quinone reductase-like Zn-dependent oxidoreductase/acyl carrier protein